LKTKERLMEVMLPPKDLQYRYHILFHCFHSVLHKDMTKYLFCCLSKLVDDHITFLTTLCRNPCKFTGFAYVLHPLYQKWKGYKDWSLFLYQLFLFR